MDNNDNKFEFLKINDLIKDGEAINLYTQNIPSAGKLNRMLLAGYYALRWIDEKIDNVTQFMENVLAIRTEAERISGYLPESEKTENLFHVEQSEKKKILVFEYGDKGAQKIGNLTSVSGEIDNIAGYHWEEDNGENISTEEQYEEFVNAVIHYFHKEKNPEIREIDTVTQFLNKHGYELRDVENTEYMPLYIYEKYTEVDGEKYNPKEIEIFAENNGDVHI